MEYHISIIKSIFYHTTKCMILQAEELAGDALRGKLLRGILDDLTGGIAYGLGRSDNSLRRNLFK